MTASNLHSSQKFEGKDGFYTKSRVLYGSAFKSLSLIFASKDIAYPKSRVLYGSPFISLSLIFASKAEANPSGDRYGRLKVGY